MLIYDVLYYTVDGRPMKDFDSRIPWESISVPPKGQVALAICINGETTRTWIDHNKHEIAKPTWAE